MDNTLHNKEPSALPADIDVTNTQQIYNYLRNLRERLRQTSQQHIDMIQSTMNIVMEMSDLATTLALTQTSMEQQPSKIKRLIMEFESLQSGDNGLSSVDAVEFHGLLADFRRLHETQLLRDSLMSFKHAKDSFEDINELLNQRLIEKKIRDLSQASSHSSQPAMSASRSLREKILAFNKASAVQGQNLLQNFTTCFSNSCPNIAASEDIKAQPLVSRSQTNSGYEGDVDSEIDNGNKKELSDPSL